MLKFRLTHQTFVDDDSTGCQHLFASAVIVGIQGGGQLLSELANPGREETVRRIRKKVYAALMGTVLAIGFVTVFSSPASAQDLYWKVGTAVSHSTVFSGSNNNNIQCFTAGGFYATMCIRYDRRTLYVRSDKADGYFKLGQFAGGSSSNIYRCQNNKANSSGNGTWVKCQWNWPKSGMYILRVGHGQADWYTLSSTSTWYLY